MSNTPNNGAASADVDEVVAQANQMANAILLALSPGAPKLSDKLFPMKLPEGIKVDPEIMMGKPCVKGTRIPVYVLLQKMAAGETEAELLKAGPQLSKTDIMAVWEYAARAAAEEHSGRPPRSLSMF
jgi:uncharacterized protein (DUF433 family)